MTKRNHMIEAFTALAAFEANEAHMLASFDALAAYEAEQTEVAAQNKTEIHRTALVAAFAARVQHEASKSNAQLSDANAKSLETIAARVQRDVRTVDTLLSCNVDVDFVNKTTVADKRFAIYSLEKLMNVVDFVMSAKKLNDMNFYIIKSAIAYSNVNRALTVKDLRTACSAEYRKSDDQALLVQNAKHIAVSTVNSQYLSTLQALLTLNVFTASTDSMNNEVYSLNRDNAIAKELLSRLA